MNKKNLCHGAGIHTGGTSITGEWGAPGGHLLMKKYKHVNPLASLPSQSSVCKTRLTSACRGIVSVCVPRDFYDKLPPVDAAACCI